MRVTVESIIKVMKERHAVPPFVVWTQGFSDSSGYTLADGHHGPEHSDFTVAALELLGFVDLASNDDVTIIKPKRIIDSRNFQVYP